MERNGWELVERPGIDAVVAVVATTGAGELILVEQYREPVSCQVVELPAGLVGDDVGAEGETIEAAAQRELEEETGFSANGWRRLTAGPPSPGQSSEIVTLMRAIEVEKRGLGGGVLGEEITTHCVALPKVADWLVEKEASGVLIDPKIWLALFFLQREAPVAWGTRRPACALGLAPEGQQ